MKFPATHKYLELLRAHYVGCSDYRIAQLIGVSPQTVSGWKNDINGMSEDIAIIIADRLELDVVQVVSEINRDRASSRVSREYYDRILKGLKSSAAAALPALLGLYLLSEQAVISV